MQDHRLGFRMLVKYPGLTLAGGLALAIAIGIGAGWYDLSGDLLRPTLPLPEGDRIVEVEMRDSAASEDERRLLHDFLIWRRDVRSIEDLGAYRTLERNLILGDARPEPVTVAEMTASAFRLARVPPLLGRPLLDGDEQPGAPPVVVLGYGVWQRRFGGRADAIGQTCSSDGPRRPSSASCRRDSPSRSTTGCGCRCISSRPGTRRSRVRQSASSAGWRREPRRRKPMRSSPTLAERDGGRLAADARASASARAGIRRRVVPAIGSWFEFAHDAPADPPRPDRCVRERRDADLRADRDARGGDRHAVRARREPRADRRSALRRSARARVCRGRRRPHRRTLGSEVGHGDLLLWPERGAAVLGQSGPEVDHDPLRGGAHVAGAAILGVLPA